MRLGEVFDYSGKYLLCSPPDTRGRIQTTRPQETIKVVKESGINLITEGKLAQYQKYRKAVNFGWTMPDSPAFLDHDDPDTPPTQRPPPKQQKTDMNDKIEPPPNAPGLPRRPDHFPALVPHHWLKEP